MVGIRKLLLTKVASCYYDAPMEHVNDLSAQEFIDTFGAEEAERVAKAAGTNLPYFRQIAGGFRRPSVELADKLVQASGQRMGFVKLLKNRRQPQQAAA